MKIILIRAYGSHVTTRQQLEYTAPTGFRFLDEPMFCFSTLNANTNPNPNCRPGHRPWPLTPWQSLPGRRPWPLTPWQSLPGHRPWPLTRFIAVSSQGRCPGRQLGLGFVLAFRVEKQNIGSSRNRNPVGAVYSN